MAGKVSLRFLDLIDEITVPWLLTIFIAITLAPSFAYVALSKDCGKENCNNGLLTDRPPIRIGDAIYFSLITESTVGYGDIKPTGFSRVLACLQIFSGVLLAGITVAKITTARGHALRQAGRLSSGTWIAMNDVPGMEPIITIAEIHFDGKTISYGGSNFSLKGNFLGMFTSELIEVEGQQLKFRYTNGDSVTDYFSQGVSTLQFSELEGKWTCYSASARDSGKTTPITFEGWRAKPEENTKLKTSPEERRQVVLAVAEAYKLRSVQKAPKQD